MPTGDFVVLRWTIQSLFRGVRSELPELVDPAQQPAYSESNTAPTSTSKQVAGSDWNRRPAS